MSYRSRENDEKSTLFTSWRAAILGHSYTHFQSLENMPESRAIGGETSLGWCRSYCIECTTDIALGKRGTVGHVYLLYCEYSVREPCAPWRERRSRRRHSLLKSANNSQKRHKGRIFWLIYKERVFCNIKECFSLLQNILKRQTSCL